ncbi:MAG: hypothetical protein NW214_04105 [Pseudanabaenaceae cyanobacterium bins.39]|nr:hypothetical protein [Pseudanabaenaceae cyanobacterium bins.39]
MFDLDYWTMEANRGDRQKKINAIELPYRCGKIEAEILFRRFLAHEAPETYQIIQPKSNRGILL